MLSAIVENCYCYERNVMHIAREAVIVAIRRLRKRGAVIVYKSKRGIDDMSVTLHKPCDEDKKPLPSMVDFVCDFMLDKSTVSRDEIAALPGVTKFNIKRLIKSAVEKIIDQDSNVSYDSDNKTWTIT